VLNPTLSSFVGTAQAGWAREPAATNPTSRSDATATTPRVRRFNSSSLGVTMDNHLSWSTHIGVTLSDLARLVFSQAGHTKTNPHPAPRSHRQRAGPKSSRGDRPSETRIRASRQGWKGRILASIPARPTTRAHTTQAPPHLRAPRRGWINSRSVAPAGWPVPGHASGRRQQRAALLAAYQTSTLLSNRWRNASTLPRKGQ
jgi:hypothetical protein